MVPILLLTGFLGSGKTTLLNRLLDDRPKEGPFSEQAGKLALIVNEFGDVGIDGDLLPDEMTRQIEIQGGCICCRLDEDLQKTLLDLEKSQDNLSAIVIETTGIAEPLPISWTLAKEELAEKFRLAAVITVVDATQHEVHRPMSESVDAQVDYADVLVIAKLDLAGKEKCSETESLLRERNRVAPVLAGNTEGIVQQLWQMIADPSFEPVRAEHSPSCPPLQNDSHAFHSEVIPILATLDFETLSEELEQLSPSYIRIKGIAKVVDGASGNTEPKWVAFHRVGARISLEPLKREDFEARMVAIGTELSRDALQACIDAAVIG